jgi:hypothetical protein
MKTDGATHHVQRARRMLTPQWSESRAAPTLGIRKYHRTTHRVSGAGLRVEKSAQICRSAPERSVLAVAVAL